MNEQSKNPGGQGLMVATIGGSDADRAKAIKAKLIEAMVPLFREMDEAYATVNPAAFNIAPGPIGKHTITSLVLAKQF